MHVNFRTLAGMTAALVLTLATAAPADAKPASKKASSAKKTEREKPGPQLAFETNKGKFVVRLFVDKAPLSTANLLAYADAGFFNGTIFHRVIPDFMVQGGGFGKDLAKKPTKGPIKNEADNGLSNVRGTLAMARTNVVDSATSQFFINVKDNPQLDHSTANFGYAVVGEVVSGMDVVDAIRQVPTLCPSYTGEAECLENLPPGMRDVPREPVVMQKVYRK